MFKISSGAKFHLIVLKSFDRQNLTKDDAFFNDAGSTPTTVDGVGQMVFFKACYIRVYKTEDTTTAVKKIDTCDGEGRVERGTTLVFEGINGKVKKG